MGSHAQTRHEYTAGTASSGLVRPRHPLSEKRSPSVAKQVIQVQCCVCHRLHMNDNWVNAPEVAQDAHNISSTYCPGCAQQSFPELWARIVERAAVVGGLLDAEPGPCDNTI